MDILIAEDNRALREIYKIKLESYGHTVRLADGGIAAKKMIDERTPDILILDLHMPKGNGDKLLAQYDNPPFKVMIVSNFHKDLEDIPKQKYDIFLSKLESHLSDIIDAIYKLS